MASETRISWTGSTWNPWTGCTRVSAGCANCYMFREQTRWGHYPNKVHRTSAHTFNSPLRWLREVERGTRTGRQRLVFVCSWSDFFHPDADKWRAAAWDIIRRFPDLIFQVLTKRPERFAQFLPPDWGNGYANVWIGVTAENQEQADRRIPILLNTPARCRFVSYEPGLGPIDLSDTGALWVCPECATEFQDSNDCCPTCGWQNIDNDSQPDHGIDWLIAGGESGPNARPFNLQWARDLRDQCAQAGVAFFFKQTGANVAIPYYEQDDAFRERFLDQRVTLRVPDGHGGWYTHTPPDGRRVNDGQPPPDTLAFGRLRYQSGSDPSEWPADLRVQQFPSGWGVEE